MSEFRPIISIILTIVLVLALVGVVQVLKKGIYEHGDDIYFVDEDGVGSSGGSGVFSGDTKQVACVMEYAKKNSVEWKKRIHSYPEVKGNILNLAAKENLALSHFSYNSISEFVIRQNRYSDIESENLFENGIKFSWFLFIWKPMREFLVRYIKHKGFLDGFYGFALTVLMMVYQLQVMIKLWELERQNK